MPPKQFFSVFSENTTFFEKIVESKLSSIKFLIKKGYIYFWCKMTPDRSHSDAVERVANKVRVPYVYVPKYHFSDALPASEIFFNFYTCPSSLN